MRLIPAIAALFLAAACAGGNEGAPGAGTTPAGETGGQETGGMCGGIAGFQCGSQDDYCAMEPGACKDVADAAGVCKPRPQVCTMEYRPVCGCVGKTYSNPCAAAGAGVSVASDGACAKGE